MSWTSTVEEGAIGSSIGTPSSGALETRGEGQLGFATSDGPGFAQAGTAVRVITVTF